MHWTLRDTVATVLVAFVVASYTAYLAGIDAPVIDETRGIAALTLILGWASRVIGGHAGFPAGAVARIARVGNFAAIALGIIATATESGVFLAASVLSIVALWMVGISFKHRSRVALRGTH